MKRAISAVSIVLYLSLSLTGCSEGAQGAGNTAFLGLMAIAGTLQSTHKHNVKMRPTVVLSAPNKTSVNVPITMEATYRVNGTVVPEWWDQNRYTVTIRREKVGDEVKSESGAHAGEGKLIVTFKAVEPGNYVMEIKTWAAGADTATEKPMAAARRTVKVR
jgi:predicted small secreted protein